MEVCCLLRHTAPFLSEEALWYSRERHVSLRLEKNSQTRPGRRPAEGLRHPWKGDIARRPCQEAAARDTPRWGAAAPSQDVRTQHERMRLTQEHNGNQGYGTRRLTPTGHQFQRWGLTVEAARHRAHQGAQRVESPRTRPEAMGLLLPSGEVSATPH